jgi:hypothetical protein
LKLRALSIESASNGRGKSLDFSEIDNGDGKCDGEAGAAELRTREVLKVGTDRRDLSYKKARWGVGVGSVSEGVSLGKLAWVGRARLCLVSLYSKINRLCGKRGDEVEDG